MNADGDIERICECGERVYYDRDCHKCGEKSQAASFLGDMFAKLVMDEIPDPASVFRDQLIRRGEELGFREVRVNMEQERKRGVGDIETENE